MAAASHGTGEEESSDCDSHRLMQCLQPSMALILAAGYANLQARLLLTAQTAQPMGEKAVMEATKGLASAFSVGSMLEFLTSPILGRISDQYGRKPLMLSLLVGPTIMRALCVLVKHPTARLWLLWLDFVSVRTIGVQPTTGLVGTMISDVVPLDAQPGARAKITASIALGQIVGNYASGWWNAKYGPESTFKVIAFVPACVFAFLASTLSETHAGVKKRCKDALTQSTVEDNQNIQNANQSKKTGAIISILRDRECLLLGLILAIYEFMQYPVLSTVANLFMKDRLGWNPLQAGRFSSAVGLAVFLGSSCSSRLLNALGAARYASFSHCSMSVAYLIWGGATRGKAMMACLLPMALGTGANTVMMTEFVARASSLGYGKGEATAVIQALGAVVRTISPQLFMKLYVSALPAGRRSNSGLRLPMGSPMLLVAAMAVIQEILHQMLLHLRSKRAVGHH